MMRRVVVGLSAATGAGYGLELLKGLKCFRKKVDLEVDLVYNDNSLMILKEERGADLKDMSILSDRCIHNSKMDDPLASGSNHFDCMVICPCSASTAAKIHEGIADNLMTRLAAVALKERRRLILVIRETPLSTPVLKALYELSSWGVIVVPASPPFYGLKDPTGKDLQKALAGRLLDLMSIDNDLTPRYRRDD